MAEVSKGIKKIVCQENEKKMNRREEEKDFGKKIRVIERLV